MPGLTGPGQVPAVESTVESDFLSRVGWEWGGASSSENLFPEELDLWGSCR